MSKKKFLIVLFVSVFGLSAFTVNNDKYFEIVKNLEIFTNVYKELNTHYVDELDPSQLMRTAIDAMVKSLDPYTNYFSESQGQSYRISTEGKYSGFGAQSKNIDGLVTVVEVYEGGSAQKSGVKAGDRIIAVDGTSVRDMTNDEVMRILRGADGTSVTLGLDRPGSGELRLDLSRGQVDIPNVPYSGEVADNIGYISLTTFTPNAGKNIGSALDKMKKANTDLEGLIIDLRFNGGGLLHEAINICNLFVPQGEELVTTKGKVKDRDVSYKTKSTPMDLEIPIVVLINKRSASASEIVSGVMQDLDRGVLIGQRSFGKGLVQNTKKVGYNSNLKITTSKYYIPSGRCIQGKEYEDGEPVDISDDRRATYTTRNGRKVLDGGGVTPDIKLERPSETDIVKSLVKDNWIFKYVTDYCQKNKEIAEIGTFKFENYTDFVQYLENGHFMYETQAEKNLNEIEEKSKSEHFSEVFNTKMNELRIQIAKEKADDLEQNKEQIIKLIEQDIASRYYYQKGKLQQSLNNDNEIEEAVKLLKDPARYQSILKG